MSTSLVRIGARGRGRERNFLCDRSHRLLYAAAEAKLARALSAVPEHSRGTYCCWGLVDISTKRAAHGHRRMRTCIGAWIEISPTPIPIIGFGKTFIGRAEETEAHVAEALRLSPRDTMAYRWMTYAGIAKSQLGRWEQAVAWFRRSIEANRNFPHPHFVLGSALAQIGRLDEARSAVKAGLALDPGFAVSRFRANVATRSNNPTHLASLEAILDGMRRAGVPED